MSTTVTPPKTTPDKLALRALVRAHYDWQHQRIAFGNRLATHFRRGLGQEPGAPTDELSKEAQQLIEDLKTEYGLLADAVAASPPSRWNKLLVEHDGLIQSPYDLAMARHYRAIEDDEDDLRAAIATLVKDFPIWEWLEGVRGVGPLMAAVIIAELDPHRAPTASCFWSYCGLGVKPDYERPALAGAFERTPEGLVLKGAGAGLGGGEGGSDQLYYLCASSGAQTQMTATLTQAPTGTAGLMLRAAPRDGLYLGRGDGIGLADDDPFYALSVDPEGVLDAAWRTRAGGVVERKQIGAVSFPLALRITCTGTRAEGAVGGPDDATAALHAAHGQRIDLPAVVLGGPFVAGSPTLRAQATFTDGVLHGRDEMPLGLHESGWSGVNLGDPAGFVRGLGQSRRKEHLVVQTYRAKDGTEQEKLGLGFSPFTKTKLVGVLGPSFLRAGGPYKTIYDQVKHRYESHPRYGLVAQEAGEKEAHKKHRHDMAIRYMVKQFLLDLWRTWRALEGLPVGESYAEAKLGLRHHRSA